MRPSRATIAIARRCLSSTRDTPTPTCIGAREWAQKRPELARNALGVPPPLVGNNAPPPLATTSLESYLKWRGWNMPKAIPPGDKDLAVSLVSHPLTFPLTLGNHMAKLVDTCSSERDDEGYSPTSRSRSNSARLCCVGARAEAALPDEYWREFLYSSILSADTEGASLSSACISIDFIGPDIAPHLQSKTVVLDTGMSWPITRSLKMDFHRMFLHQYISKKYREEEEAKGRGNPTDGKTTSNKSFDPTFLLSLWDGFVLFNPGVGHPNLAKGWLPTLRYVLKTKRPVLFTAHSHLDSERDWSVLKATMRDLGQEERLHEIIARWHGSTGGDDNENPYKNNPFASRIDYEDPFCDDGDEKNKFVRPNMFSLFLARQR